MEGIQENKHADVGTEGVNSCYRLGCAPAAGQATYSASDYNISMTLCHRFQIRLSVRSEKSVTV